MYVCEYTYRCERERKGLRISTLISLPAVPCSAPGEAAVVAVAEVPNLDSSPGEPCQALLPAGDLVIILMTIINK